MHAQIVWGQKPAGKKPLAKPWQDGRISKQLLKAWNWRV